MDKSCNIKSRKIYSDHYVPKILNFLFMFIYKPPDIIEYDFKMR